DPCLRLRRPHRTGRTDPRAAQAGSSPAGGPRTSPLRVAACAMAQAAGALGEVFVGTFGSPVGAVWTVGRVMSPVHELGGGHLLVLPRRMAAGGLGVLGGVIGGALPAQVDAESLGGLPRDVNDEIEVLVD